MRRKSEDHSRVFETPKCLCIQSLRPIKQVLDFNLYRHFSFRIDPHFARVLDFNSGEIAFTRGNLSRMLKGFLVASMIIDELLYSLMLRFEWVSAGSMAFVGTPLTMSMSSEGSHLLMTANSTSWRFDASTSSSTIITALFIKTPAWEPSAAKAACFACPANDCLMDTTKTVEPDWHGW